MNKIVSIFFGFILSLFSAQVLGVESSTSKMVPPPDTTTSPLGILGQDHYYSVTFRGNSEAVVTAKFVINNNEEQPLSKVTLRVPKVLPTDIIGFQVTKQPSCIRYQNPAPLPIYDQSNMIPTYPEPVCLEYQEPNYQYWDWGNYKYQKATTDFSGDTIEVTLPQEIKPSQSGSFVLYFRALGYAKKNLLGTYNFTFETLKVEDRIRNLTVGITTDSDLKLKDAKGEVNYRFTESFANLKAAPNSGQTAVANREFDSFYNQIGQGSITKTARELQPLDSYTVKGAFADSYFKLYAKGIFFGVVIFLGVFLGGFLIVKKLFRRFSTRVVQPPKLSSESKLMPGTSRTLLFAKSLLLSFATSLLIVIYTIILIIVSGIFNSSVTPYEARTIMQIIIVLISILVYSLLVFGPAIYFGMKKSFWWGVVTFVLTILWLIFYFTVFLIIGLLFSNRTYYPQMIQQFNKI